ncbi:hypothetical protein [Methanosphaera sp. BMS]|uniref:hypothetical protein n=1 Tax=Methanosphaera sp. BMS TaxID=1789762 RepID=UPI000DC1D712|nr:hypothetical protein [Methanosphaera sp. BMS]AWX31702.1 hypothetical protein AW729_00745 [Methanosphaera sp. BMS]
MKVLIIMSSFQNYDKPVAELEYDPSGGKYEDSIKLYSLTEFQLSHRKYSSLEEMDLALIFGSRNKEKFKEIYGDRIKNIYEISEYKEYCLKDEDGQKKDTFYEIMRTLGSMVN